MIHDTALFYLERFGFPVEFLKNEEAPENLGIIVVIPCFNEPDLTPVLTSLLNCNYPGCGTEIIVVINHPEGSSTEIVFQNEKTASEISDIKKSISSQWLRLHSIKAFNLPKKKSGVGLARKIGMDESIRRFKKFSDSRGIICSLDADSTCDLNYLAAVKNHFNENPKSTGASIYFEHPLTFNFPTKIIEGISAYELHLRYLVHSLRFSGFPYSYYTLGSCMAFPAEIYMKQGGMNTRKAGEDFYFLQKIIALGDFQELNNTTVYPSPRVSNRVPFGTGRAMKDWFANECSIFFTYNNLIFNDLKYFISMLSSVFEAEDPNSILGTINLPDSISEYLGSENWRKIILYRLVTSKSKKVYSYKVFSWFNGLKAIKYLNYARKFYPDIPVEDGAKWLLKVYYMIDDTDRKTLSVLLEQLRHIDRHSNLN